MEFSEIISISGMSGLFRLVSTKGNGIIVTNLEDGKSTFISSRMHNVSALENIGIYRDNDESTPLREVMQKMEENEKKLPVPAPNETHDKLKAYLVNILPDFDQERVHYSDLKKLVRWYATIKSKSISLAEPEPVAAETEAPKAEKEEVKETKKATKKAEPAEEAGEEKAPKAAAKKTAAKKTAKK